MHCCTFSTVHNAMLHLGAVVTMHSYVHNALCHIFDCPKCISNHYESTWQCPHLHFSKLWPRPVQKGGGGSTPPPFWSTRLQPRYRVKHGPSFYGYTQIFRNEKYVDNWRFLEHRISCNYVMSQEYCNLAWVYGYWSRGLMTQSQYQITTSSN